MVAPIIPQAAATLTLRNASVTPMASASMEVAMASMVRPLMSSDDVAGVPLAVRADRVVQEFSADEDSSRPKAIQWS